MTSWAGKLGTAWKSALTLGWEQAGLYALYQVLKKSGWLRVRLPTSNDVTPCAFPQEKLFHLPPREAFSQLQNAGFLQKLVEEANEIVAGRVRLFGGEPVPLRLEPRPPLRHALEYGDRVDGADIKFTWEPARLGWAVVLARAYFLTREAKYPQAFWKYLREFQASNPLNSGPNWASGQEVAIRLVGLIFAAEIFADGAKQTDLEWLAGYIRQHVQRIPPTLIYARAQNNNHLLTEALGLLAGGAWLAEEHMARRGAKWLNRAFQQQVDDEGEYVQHSSNYHRLALQTALWANWIRPQVLNEDTRHNLQLATAWLLRHMDVETGRAVNLGHNDGALIFPLAVGGAEDYRSVAQAAGRAFLGREVFPAGDWDEESIWLGLASAATDQETTAEKPVFVKRLTGRESWASLRGVNFNSRPAHADQLHVDIWWRGTPVTLDAGTYLYNDDPPWDNGLAGARVHNTAMVDEEEPMRRAGKFLWLNWDQARLIHEPDFNKLRIAAERDGYLRKGIRHQRVLERCGQDSWRITDTFLPTGKRAEHPFSVQWLLPDGEWQLKGNALTLHTSVGVVEVKFGVVESHAIHGNLVRGGVLLAGSGEVDARRGWVSTLYGSKQPALSMCWWVQGAAPLSFTTEFLLKSVIRPA